MDKKLILALIGVLIVGVFSTWFFLFYEPEKKITNPSMIQQQEVIEKYEEVMGDGSADELRDAEKELLFYEDATEEEYFWGSTSEKFVSLDKNAVEFPNTKEYYNRAIGLLEKQDYYSVAKLVGDVVLDYNFTNDGNSELLAFYKGAAKMQNYTYAPHSERRNIIKSVKSPLALSMITLFTDPHYRDEIIVDESSLSPLVIGELRLTESKLLDKNSNDYNTYAAFADFEVLKNIYQFTFEIPENDSMVKAIVAQDITHSLKIIGFYGIRNGELHQTQEFWNNDTMWYEN